MSYTRKDYKILTILYNKSCFDIVKAMTIKRMIEETSLSDNKIRKTIKKFIESGYVAEGLKNERTKTYYLTKEGLEQIKPVIKHH